MSWVAVAAGAGAFLANSGSKQGGSTTQTSDPWSGVQPYLADLFARSQQAQGTAGQYPTSPLTQQAINAYGTPGSLVPQAQQQLGQTIGGDYLSASSNPYLSGAIQQALNQVKQNVSGQFSGENYGSSANQEWLAKSLAGTALPIYAQNYQNERQNQLNAINLAPGLQSAQANQLAVGGQLQQAQQAQQYYAPFDLLSRYQQLISGQPGGSTTSPYFTNPLASGLGGALAGAQLYNQFQRPTQFQSASGYNSVGANSGGYDYGSGANLGLYGGT